MLLIFFVGTVSRRIQEKCGHHAVLIELHLKMHLTCSLHFFVVGLLLFSLIITIYCHLLYRFLPLVMNL